MIFINDNLSMGKINLCQFRIRSPHIADKVFYPISFGFLDRRKISNQMTLCPVREDVQNPVNGRRGILAERKLLNTLIFMQGVCKKSSQLGGMLEIAW